MKKELKGLKLSTGETMCGYIESSRGDRFSFKLEKPMIFLEQYDPNSGQMMIMHMPKYSALMKPFDKGDKNSSDPSTQTLEIVYNNVMSFFEINSLVEEKHEEFYSSIIKQESKIII